jgi:hypothetical protein
MPIFDSYGDPVGLQGELARGDRGYAKLKIYHLQHPKQPGSLEPLKGRPRGQYRASGTVTARLSRNGRQLITPNGCRFRVIAREGDRLRVGSMSCASFATELVAQYFPGTGVGKLLDTDPRTGTKDRMGSYARNLVSHLLRSNKPRVMPTGVVILGRNGAPGPREIEEVVNMAGKKKVRPSW